MDNARLLDHLRSLESDLLKGATRASREALEKLLSEDFVEFGSSGQVFDRESIIESLSGEEGTTAHSIHDFTLARLAADAALVTYRIESRSSGGKLLRESLRSSTWVHEGGGWVIRFHQGTRKP